MKKIPRGEYRISITSACNMKCVYCHNEGQSSFAQLSLNDIDLLLANSYDLEVTSVRLTGGEPLIHPDIIDICKLIKHKYHLQVGINTNLIKFDIILELLKNHLIDKLVVGMDYYDGKVSKNSPVGISSKIIRQNLSSIKNMPISIAVDMVYTNNKNDIDKMMKYCLNNGFEIKVLEDIGNLSEEYHKEFMLFVKSLAQKYGIELYSSKEEFDQFRGYKGKKRVASFFNSLCYDKKCALCKNMHLRVSAKGVLHSCAIKEDDGICFKGESVRNNILKML